MRRTRTVPRRAVYSEAIEWIAYNDAAADKVSAHEIAGFISVMLVADVWKREPIDVARAVIKRRVKLGIWDDSDVVPEEEHQIVG